MTQKEQVQKHLADDNNRYMTLAGDRIHTPLRKAFFQADDFKAGMMAGGLTYCAYNFLGNPNHAIFLAIVNTSFNIFCSGFYRVAENYLLYKRFGSNSPHHLAIDTQPTKNTPPTTPTHLGAASYSKLMFSIWAGLSIGFDVVKFVSIGFNPLGTIDRLMLGASSYVRMYQGFRRFNNVSKGDWTIIDTPPPKKATQTEKQTTPMYLRPQTGTAP